MKRRRSLCRLALALVSCLLSITAQAGPNAGGTMILHYHSALGATCDPATFQGLLDDCNNAIVNAPAASQFPPSCDQLQVWYAYAAFPPGSLPRLSGICFGIDYLPFSAGTGIAVLTGFTEPDAVEAQSPNPPWPAPGSGIALAFHEIKTSLIVPIYAFVGYGSPGQHFVLRPHPQPSLGGKFADDYLPANLDDIAGFGDLGFGTAGTVVCPAMAAAPCCVEDGSCIVLSPVECVSQRGVPLSNGMPCEPNPCPAVVGPCCFEDGTCSLSLFFYCEWSGGYFGEEGELCTPDPCYHEGACCYPDGSCAFVPESECPTGDWHWLISCSPDGPCQAVTGACCDRESGDCQVLTSQECADLGSGHEWNGPDTSCTPNPCVPTPTQSTTWGKIKYRYR